MVSSLRPALTGSRWMMWLLGCRCGSSAGIRAGTPIRASLRFDDLWLTVALPGLSGVSATGSLSVVVV